MVRLGRNARAETDEVTFGRKEVSREQDVGVERLSVAQKQEVALANLEGNVASVSDRDDAARREGEPPAEAKDRANVARPGRRDSRRRARVWAQVRLDSKRVLGIDDPAVCGEMRACDLGLCGEDGVGGRDREVGAGSSTRLPLTRRGPLSGGIGRL